jgi:hypothetical protein
MALKLMKPLRDPAEADLPPITSDPKYAAELEALHALEKRFAQSETRRRIGLARRKGQRPTRSAAQRAQSLLAGGEVRIAPPEVEVQNAEEEMDILKAAICAQHEKLDALRSELSFAACSRFSQLNDEALRAALAAVEQLHAALESGRVVRVRLISAGFVLNETALALEQFPAGCVLGSPDDGRSPAWLFKQRLRARGIVG